MDIVSGEPLFASTQEVRQRLRLAELHGPARAGQRGREAGSEPRHDPDRGPLEPRGQPPRPRLRRRPARGGRPALLHQLGRPALRALRGPRGRGLRTVQGALRRSRRRRRRSRHERAHREGDPGRRMLLGHAGPHPQAPRRAVHPGGLHRRRRGQRHLPQPREPRRGHRDHLRSRSRPPTATCSSSSSRSTTRPR